MRAPCGIADASANSQPLLSWWDYDLLEKMSEGFDATVYRARSRTGDRLFAARIMSRSDVDEPIVLPELAVMQAVAHPNVIKSYDVFVWEGKIVLIYEYCPGGSLEDLIAENGSVGLGRFRALAYQMAKGLAEIHAAGFVHGNLRAGDVLFADRERRHVKITGFGLVSLGGATQGPAWPSPEPATGLSFDGQAADVFAMGRLFSLMLNGSASRSCLDLLGGVGSGHRRARAEIVGEPRAVLARMLAPEQIRIRMPELLLMRFFHQHPMAGKTGGSTRDSRVHDQGAKRQPSGVSAMRRGGSVGDMLSLFGIHGPSRPL
jgi:serine/threonine protein kinase